MVYHGLTLSEKCCSFPHDFPFSYNSRLQCLISLDRCGAKKNHDPLFLVGFIKHKTVLAFFNYISKTLMFLRLKEAANGLVLKNSKA